MRWGVWTIGDGTTTGGISTLNTNLNNYKCYVGMIIHSTTLDTQAKVIAQYGGTKWIQHSGYMLRGATSGVTANSASKTGGADSIDLSHSHTVNSHSHTIAHTHKIASHSHTTPNHSHTYGFGFGTFYGAAHGEGGLWIQDSGSMTWKAPTGGGNKTVNINNAMASEAGSKTIGTIYTTASTSSTNGGNTGGSGDLTSQGSSAANSGNASPDTNSKLSSTQSVLNQYKSVYIWECVSIT